MSEPPDSATERFSRFSSWANRIISASLGIVVTVVAALVIARLEAREPHLVYSSAESLPFNGPNGDVSIYQITITNDGKQEVNGVAAAVRVADCKINQYKVTANPLLSPTVAVSGDSLTIQIPGLNPAESVQISMLVSATQNAPARPQIALRGQGVNGTEKTQATSASLDTTLPYVSLLAATLAVLTTGSVASFLRSKAKSRPFGLPGSGDDQRQVLAYICRAHGLKDLADQFSAQTHETTFWAEADRLGQIAIDSNDEGKMGTIERALLALVEYRKVADISKAIVFYNVALISRTKKDDSAYKKYLALSKETAPNEIDRRLKVDPRFGPDKPLNV